MNAALERAKELFLAGVRAYEAGKYEEAHAKFEGSLALVPHRPSTLMNLGATRIQLARFDDAAEVLEEATRIDPSDAHAWGHLATALAELGRFEEALAAADRALAVEPRMPQVWSVRGMVLRDLRRQQDAVDSFGKAIGYGADAELHAYYIAALTGEETPTAAPKRYVQTLFDSYADGFEEHLVEVLRYDAPGRLFAGLPEREWTSALDLGCGTGLMGERLRPRVRRLIGVDLSANMVAHARQRGVYDDVVQADIGAYLDSSSEQHDLVTAADVFNYVGELAPLFAAVHRVLEPGGWFAFTVELGGAGVDTFVLQPSMRYAHSRRYVEALSREAGFDVAAMAEHAIREDQRAPIAGLFAWLVRR